MTLPAAYNEATLAFYMVASLGAIAPTLGLLDEAMYEAVNDVVQAYGVTDIAAATDIAKLRALAKVAALGVAQTTAATYYDFSADGGDHKRSQVMAQLATLLMNAETAAFAYTPNYGLEIGTVHYVDDPYDWDIQQEAAGVG
jgi:hypothetical protein